MSRFLYAFLGMFSGLGVPFCWIVWRAFSTRRDWWMKWLHTEIHDNDHIYIFLTLFAVCISAVIGYLLGKTKDDLALEASTVKDTNFELSQMAITDGLTGLFNTRHIHNQLEIELENSRQSPLACLLVDIDHFKAINDTYGHPAGDVVLTVIAKILKRAVRRFDVVGRLGGEEFLIILPHSNEDNGEMVAERIRGMVESEKFIVSDERQIKVTVSVGVAFSSAMGARDKDHILSSADQALYEAKRGGRNKVVIHRATI